MPSCYIFFDKGRGETFQRKINEPGEQKTLCRWREKCSANELERSNCQKLNGSRSGLKFESRRNREKAR